MRVLLLPAVLVLSACDSTGIVLSSGDAGWDHWTAPDILHDPDVRTDRDPDPDPDPPREDPWHDWHDPDTGCTPVLGGICNVVEQCGCMPAYACVLAQDFPTCTIVEDCQSGLGGLEPGEECFGDECRPGTSCLCRGSDCNCHEWCLDSSDCSDPGTECAIHVSFTLISPCSGTGTVDPYMVCTLPCPPSKDCDLFATGTDPTGCPDGQACVRDMPVAAGGCDVNLCAPEGAGEEGDDCSIVHASCRRGMGCYGNDTTGYYCMRYCDGSHPCTTGTCTAIGSESLPELGICIP